MNGPRMRELRKSVGLFQVEVALELGLDNETICRWEKREHWELPKVYAEALERLVADRDRLVAIKLRRRDRRLAARKSKSILRSSGRL